MGDNATLWLPEGRSTLAPSVDALFNFVNIVSIIIFAGVVVSIIYLAFRYRRRHEHERAVLVHENTLLEVAWVVVPVILVLVTFFWGFKVFMKIEVAPPDSYEIGVEARQWQWTFTYPNGAVTTNELHVPLGRPVRMNMSSVDVIHSFFVPVMRVKQDVLPNRYSHVWFQATKPGTYQIFCAEYCGLNHSAMLAKLIVQTPEDYQKWLESVAVPTNLTPVEYGQRLYQQQGCMGCHTTDGSPRVGPTFKGLFGHTVTLQNGQTLTADENYIRESILESTAKIVQGYPPIMPTSYSSLEEDQVTALIAFIKSLK
ncbi:MAG TPA: cytochrome c oxidase subunit II [Rhodothermales bacterium]|nr:cytochrome c oxidase subunit II [Rhodothermales bacterium]